MVGREVFIYLFIFWPLDCCSILQILIVFFFRNLWNNISTNLNVYHLLMTLLFKLKRAGDIKEYQKTLKKYRR